MVRSSIYGRYVTGLILLAVRTLVRVSGRVDDKPVERQMFRRWAASRLTNEVNEISLSVFNSLIEPLLNSVRNWNTV